MSDLSKDGTYGGNESIVAFSRLYNCCVVIHQPNLPRWEVHPEVGMATRSYAQIAYLHGDHYCSVIPIEEGDVSPVIKQTQNVRKRVYDIIEWVHVMTTFIKIPMEITLNRLVIRFISFKAHWLLTCNGV